MKRMSRCVQLAAVLLFSGTAQAAVINVPAGGDLQAAINNAQPGDTIVLQAGARYVGQFKFPAKAGMVTLTSSGTLPNGRISTSDAPQMATIASGLTMMAIDMYGAKNWTLDGIRFEANVGGYGEIIGIDAGENILLKRLLLVVPSPQEQKRFVLGNGRNITLTQSYCSGIWRSGQDSQCFVAWDGAGPYTITDNFLEAASENVMFGGADSTSPDNIPSDILVENNLFTKRLEWKGQPRGVKNIFELKSARRVVVRNNIFERNWVDAQGGTAIVFTPRNQSGTAPWTVVEDVLFERNIVRDTPSHFNILGYDDIAPSGQTTRITIRQNLLLGSGGGRLALIGNEVGSLTFDHNTYIAPHAELSMVELYAEGGIATATGSRKPSFAVDAFTFTNMMANHNAYGLRSSVAAHGTASLIAMTKTHAWMNNVLAAGWGTYPATTTFLPLADYPAQFDANYYLALSSPFNSMATDGTDIGWTATGSTEPPPPPPPPPPTSPVAIVSGTCQNGRATVPYSTQLSASGGTGAYSWRLQSGALPPGLTLEQTTGKIVGTPTTAGASAFAVAACDASDPSNCAASPYNVTIAAPVSVATASLPNALRNQSYTATLASANALGTVQWRIASGALPVGLTLDATTGVISGRPTRNGSATFVVAVSDSNTTASRQFTIKVANK